ncbi:MAG: tRNA (adenosine(37)-N6)-dimethylallyltransferase MiaA [Pseudodonghicola sp.]|nr:tRNA (adenosine(37)-N6)-dimethylallyltransferase MiaA [Pseudodonghicola sp.]
MLRLNKLPDIPDKCPVLIAGPTASGKSALALDLAQARGGVVVNADASQVFSCWRILTARPSPQDEAIAPHRLYGHVPCDAEYSAGHWLREVAEILKDGERPIIVGGTGLYFSALTQGLAKIPPTPPDLRAEADQIPLATLIGDLDPGTASRLDLNNRMRVQRAWEVQRATGRSLADWQADTPPPLLPLAETVPLVFDVPKDWLLDRITRRFDAMLEQGALEEVKAMQALYDPALPAFKAIGVPELMAYITGEIPLNEARTRATIATRQFAKRQRTWFRSKMRHWLPIPPAS